MVQAERQTTQSVEADAVEVTRRYFAEHHGALLSPDEARECNRRLARLFGLLDEWDQAERERQP